ncbi:MAG: hypothetical protein OEV92_10920 [Nitrospinota bacterium]|nr:hypothetical protein [Nitrospinota bacterium]
MNRSILFSVYFTLFIVFALWAPACGSKKDTKTKEGSTASPTTPVTSGACGPSHEMSGHKVVWERHQCDTADTLWVDQSTRDDKGVALGDRDVSHGKMSVKYHGLTNKKISSEATFGVYFKADGYDMEVKNETVPGYADWQFLSMKEANGVILSKLVATRHDGSCGGYCVDEDYKAWQLQYTDPEDIVQFDCEWNLSAVADVGKVYCVVSKVTSGQSYIFITTMNGPYMALLRLGVGKHANDAPPHPNYQAQVSDFKVTIFE